MMEEATHQPVRFGSDITHRLEIGAVCLPPLKLTTSKTRCTANVGWDSVVEVEWPGQPGKHTFFVAAKASNTPRTIRTMIEQVKMFALAGGHPMIIVPFLSPERLKELLDAGVSGLDLCGNGVVIVPGKLSVFHTGHPNCYPQSRPLGNPYQGLSAMVARMLLKHPNWTSLNSLAQAIQEAGTDMSLSQVSKAIDALADDLMVASNRGLIRLLEPLQLLDRLGQEWSRMASRRRLSRGRSPRRLGVRLTKALDWAGALSSNQALRWAVTGESSAARYVTFGQGGPPQVAVADLELALSLLPGSQAEAVPSFADLRFVETEEAGFFFDNDQDERGVRWASELQTWLEMQAGDGRQQEAAREIRSKILKSIL